MRHRNSGRRLGRNASHRKPPFNHLVTSLLPYGRIETTAAKANELRGFAHGTIPRRASAPPLIPTRDNAAPGEKATLYQPTRPAPHPPAPALRARARAAARASGPAGGARGPRPARRFPCAVIGRREIGGAGRRTALINARGPPRRTAPQSARCPAFL